MQKISKLPNTCYRVSAKAVIKNSAGQVLVVREDHSSIEESRWALPGGGVDHGETIEQALYREIKEELGVSGVKLRMKPLGNNIRYVDSVQFYKMDVIYTVEIADDFSPTAGKDVLEIAWKNPTEFKNSEYDNGQIIYKFGK
ncbi:MAG: NUDIX hydrolase [Candidatus Nomurabacteria bacterium]|jgi:8-oxo-dGTP diphosphatase|nr:NUDIX hydrolase [Candidatus Nomurabacteria bacterium]